MTKRNRGFTEEKYRKWLKEGRGKGELSDYKPWINIQDISSLGNSCRIFSYKTKRQHQLLSNNEKYYFFILEYFDSVIDIREQYPLLFREDTLSIANELGIQHPKDPSTQVDIVMTTDFLITLFKNNKYYTVARTIKEANELEKERVINKFDIEMEFWKRKNVDWGILTENDINFEFGLNLEYLRNFLILSDKPDVSEINETLLKSLLLKLKNEICQNQYYTVREVVHNFDFKMKLNLGTSIALLNHLIYTKQVKIDLSKKLDYDKYLLIESNSYIKEESKII